jgi:hypothetical protein
MTRKEQLERQLAAVVDRLAELNAQPVEPQPIGGETPVIRWDMRFTGCDITYSYTAIVSGKRWYLSGNRNPGPMTWDELMDWIQGRVVGSIWRVTSYEELT